MSALPDKMPRASIASLQETRTRPGCITCPAVRKITEDTKLVRSQSYQTLVPGHAFGSLDDSILRNHHLQLPGREGRTGGDWVDVLLFQTRLTGGRATSPIGGTDGLSLNEKQRLCEDKVGPGSREPAEMLIPFQVPLS